MIASNPFVKATSPVRNLLMAVALQTGWSPRQMEALSQLEFIGWVDAMLSLKGVSTQVSTVPPSDDPRTIELPPAVLTAMRGAS
jgi:hypothetical protein